MSYKTIAVRRLSPQLGAEIEGADLSRPLLPEQFAEIRRALNEHLVIFFRDQRMTPEEQMRFAGMFGPFYTHPAAPKRMAEHPEILVVHADANSTRIDGEDWHSDNSCDTEPPMASVLHLLEVPPVGGDTLFSSMYAAYEALSEPMKAMLDGMTAIHDGTRQYAGRYGTEKAPRAEHPVFRTHPETGRKALFVNRIFTSQIVQLKKAESDAVLQFLFRHVERPEFQYRFSWRPNSVAMWDNRSAQHCAIWDYYPERRHGHRVTIRGERPH